MLKKTTQAIHESTGLTRSRLLFFAGVLIIGAGCQLQEFDRSLSAPDSNPNLANANTEEQQMMEEPLYNPFVDTNEDPLATFSVDVDTASYTLMRRNINEGILPDPTRVRVEEYVNYFKYDYPAPTPEDPEPFSITLEAAPSYFGEGLNMLRVGIKGQEIPESRRPVANIVLLLDVSGSMQSADRIGYVKYAAKTLVNALAERDTVAIVTYAGEERVALEPTEVSNRTKIINAIDNLTASGSTNGEAGLRRAYELAESFRCENRVALQVDCSTAINRVILATDGDFNVGVSNEEATQLVASWRDRGIFLSALGVGDIPNDLFLEDITNQGNGNYYYIDSLGEARRVLEDELGATMQVIAEDVKVQVVFNDEVISRYRLVGYENRVLNDEDFEDDTVDAGEIGSGHTVTAYLEFEMRDGVAETTQPEPGILQTDVNPEFAESQFIDVRVRYKDPGANLSKEVVKIVPLNSLKSTFSGASNDFRWGVAVNEYAEILRKSPFVDGNRFDDIIAVAQGAIGDEAQNRQEFIDLVSRAKELWAGAGLATGGRVASN